MNAKILITGGAKSGKSAYALELARNLSGKKYFIATAQAMDDEMKRKIEKHKKERNDGWATIEEPTDIARAINELSDTANVVVVDCLNLWTSNLLEENGEERFGELLSGLASSFKLFAGSIIGVTNEVGWGIVPADAQTRLFRERLGNVNRRVAACCTNVTLMVSGIPVSIKGEKN